MALLAPLVLLALQQAPPAGASAAPELLARAAQATPAEREALLDRLVALGSEAERAALDGFEEAPLAERRVRSAVLRQVGGDPAVGAVARLVRDPDREVRADLIELLARAGPDSPTLSERAQALAERARHDLDPALRQRTRQALAELPGEAGLDQLERLLELLPDPGRSGAARFLAEAPAARDRVVRRVQAAFEAAAAPGNPQALPDDVLAPLLRYGYGRALAETPAGGASVSDLVPFLLGGRHPSRRVREAAARSLDQMIARLVYLGEARRADRVLADLLARGADPLSTWLRRGLFALGDLADPDAAVRAGEAIAEQAGAESSEEAFEWRWRGGMLVAYGELGAGRTDRARAALDSARAAARAMRGLRWTPAASGRSATGPEAHVRLCQTLIAAVLADLADGRSPLDPDVLEEARAAHEELLRAQLQAARTYPSTTLLSSWDQPLLDDPLAPSALLRPDRALPALSSERSIELSFALNQALAAVSPDELPGFRPETPPPARLFDPTADPSRRAVLLDLFFQERRSIEARLARLDPSDPRLEIERRRLRRRLAVLEQEQRKEIDAGFPSLAKRRERSEAGLRLAEGLRQEGRAAEARELVERMRADLERSGARGGTYGSEVLAARIDLSVGASLTDEGDGAAAEREILHGLERLEELEAELAAAGFDTGPVRRERAAALVSLAVNANVKLRDAEKAVDYFERAYELRQDDWMRVLLACYRARVGRAAEARAVLAGTPSSPAEYYNLACTHALLGDPDLALDYLARDFRENHASAASLARQQEWARDDPDLASLREDPRFQRLLRMPFGGYD